MALDIITKQPYSKSEYDDEKLMELMRCVEDPLYFMTRFMKIQHATRGAIEFIPYPFQIDMIKAFHDHRFVVALTARQMGKRLWNETPILTPSGFSKMGSLKVGDTIFGKDGKPATISFITETMTDCNSYEIEFTHGETIVADAEHLWTINIPGYKNQRTETVTTDRMIELQNYYRGMAGGQSISINHCDALEFEDAVSPVDPYLFGVWLGDGSVSSSVVTCHSDDYAHYAEQAGVRGYQVGTWSRDKRTEKTGYFGLGRLFTSETKSMRRTKANPDGKKLIPHEMLYTSFEKRLALLQGLMDTDGTVEKNGVCRFYQSDENLIKQVRFLLSTLGIKSTLRVKTTPKKDCYVLTFTTDLKVCSLPRKVERMAAMKNHPKNTRIYIKSITPVESVPMRCLQVENADHLFLAGETLVPTHNTTCAAGYLLWRAMFVPDTTILLTANKLVQALEIMERIRYAYENLPDYIRAGITEYNKGNIGFDNGSRIISRATSSDAGRGLAISLLYLDEFAFVMPNKANEFWTSIQPTLSTGGDCIITSTPKSDEDQFAQIYKGAIDNTDEYGNINPTGVGRNKFFAVTVPWHAHPDRDETWAEPYRQQLGENRFKQEFECEFVTDDETLIDPLKLLRMKGAQPEFYTNTARWYSAPLPNRTYMLALDPSMGTGGDDAAIQVFMLPEMVQIAEWQHNRTDPRNQVRILMQLLLFLDAELRDNPEQQGDPEIYWTVENNSLGEAILVIIEDTGEERFPGLFVSEKKRKGQTRRFRKGFNTDNRKKLSACARLKSLVESDRMTINSKQLIREMKNFVHKEASFAAKPGEKDDLTSATLLIVRMLEVVLAWGNDVMELREFIGESELYENDPMPVVI